MHFVSDSNLASPDTARIGVYDPRQARSAPHLQLPSERREAKIEKLVHAHAKAHLWADNFNNLKKCWEPLLEQFMCSVLYEQVR
jgi:hypothetical protein